MTEREKDQAEKIVRLRIENDQKRFEIEKLHKLLEMWKYSNAELCRKLEQVDQEKTNLKTDLIKLRNAS